MSGEGASVVPGCAGGRSALYPPARRSLFRKYVVLFVVLVSGALLTSSVIDLWFIYQGNLTTLKQLQAKEAVAAAASIGQFLDEIEAHMRWAVRPLWGIGLDGLDQRRDAYFSLLRLAPAISQVSYLDRSGNSYLRLSRVAINATGGSPDEWEIRAATSAWPDVPYRGEVYFLNASEPHMRLGVADRGPEGGVTVAEVNLTFVRDVISTIQVGRAGVAYVVDQDGRLIAYPDISPVLQQTNLGDTPQVQAALGSDPSARSGDTVRGRSLGGQDVMSYYQAIAPLGWWVFVDWPLAEAFEPVYQSALRTAVLLAIGVALSALVSLALARRMVAPIRALQEGAAHIGGGELDRRIAVRTGDELETLADEFNRMAARLRESYAGLEQRVEERTQELRALGDVSRVVTSSLDLQQVLTTIVHYAVDLSRTDGGAIYEYDESADELRLRATERLGDDLRESLRATPLRLGEGAVGLAGREHRAVQIEDIEEDGAYRGRLRELLLADGFRSLLALPLLADGRLLGGLVVARRTPGSFSSSLQGLLQTFGNQSALAIQNARLYSELEEKSRELEIASRHKSLFVANVSHELRTPLNAVLNHTRNVIDLYLPDGDAGPIPTARIKDRLQRVVDNGQDLLGLIEDVLDLSKIEVGLLSLSTSEFSVGEVARAVCARVEPLAADKGLSVTLRVDPDLPPFRGDQVKIAQVLRNLIHNAIKFTDTGMVAVEVTASDQELLISVQDTGPGIAESAQAKIFEAFHQVDNSTTRKKGGTGLGLAIARRIVELHGGRIWVESAPGRGATFRFTLPMGHHRMDE